MDFSQYSEFLSPMEVRVTDTFWKQYMETARTKVIPYQWEAFNDRIAGAEPSYCMHNFKAAARVTQQRLHGAQKDESTDVHNGTSGEDTFYGCVFQDSDFAKWIEAVGFSLMWHKDAALESTADGAINVVCAAQQPDGYLDTYFIINGLEKRWTNLQDNHELYCLGHLIEGAVAYYQATGKDKLLNAVIRYVDYVDSVFGPQPEKKHGYPGHEVIELALVRLYGITKNEKHLALAKYFIDERGKKPLYFEEEVKAGNHGTHWQNSYFQYQYYQAGKPVREQSDAEGHAVRAVYLYSGMADVARLTQDETLLAACERLWDSITKRQMYITGSIGSSEYGEAFTYDYDLPNDTVYAETCASIGLVFFARRMLEMAPKAKYANIMEKALYNGILSGISLDGQRFFYVNPLEVVPEASLKDHGKAHVKVERQKWFRCACCPPNVARLLSSVSNYIYSAKDDALYMHLYIGTTFTHKLGGQAVSFAVTTNYPWEEDVTVQLSMADSAPFACAFRLPDWCAQYTITVNGQTAGYTVKDGYAYLQRTWENGDTVTLHFAMPVQLIEANPRVREDVGKVAVMRGPVVYCLEEEDNGDQLHRVSLGGTPAFTCKYEPDLLDGVVSLQCKGRQLCDNAWDDGALYKPCTAPAYEEKSLKWIPYYAWANRTPGEMMVWVRK